MKKNSTPKVKAPSIAEERAELEKTPVIVFDLLTARELPTASLVKILRTLSKADDWIVCDGLLAYDGEPSKVNALPVKPLRDWLKVCTAETVKIHVEFGSYNAWTGRGYVETKSAPLFIVEYFGDGIKGRATFKMSDPKGAKFVVTVTKNTPDAKVEQKIDSWISKACSKDDARPEMMKPYGNFAADGYRLHYDRRLSLDLPRWDEAPYYAESCKKMPARVTDVLTAASHVDNCALVDTASLIAAMKQMKKANKESACLSVNGRLDVSTTAMVDMVSTIRQTVTDGYQHAGENVKFDINPQYVIDALSGMTGDVILGISEPTENGGRTLYISDGQREAVIMSKNS